MKWMITNFPAVFSCDPGDDMGIFKIEVLYIVGPIVFWRQIDERRKRKSPISILTAEEFDERFIDYCLEVT